MYSEMHILCYNIKKYYMKYSQNWGVHSYQIDGQAFTSSYTFVSALMHQEIMRLRRHLSKSWPVWRIIPENRQILPLANAK